jgi:para-aminobenzoate synthetase/4-amino-4-deoxychorismate lyase
MRLKEILSKVVSIPGAAFFYTPSIYYRSKSYLFTKPELIISADEIGTVESSFLQINNAVKNGLTGYGFISYEAGYAFEKKLKKFSADKPLLRFYFFNPEDFFEIDSEKIDITLRNAKDFRLSSFNPNTGKEKFSSDVERVKKYIEEGDTYQINYTIKAGFNFEGNIQSFFEKLIFNQSAKYTAFINDEDKYIISLSPELFFEVKKNKITAAPMKGTSPRGIDQIHDSWQKQNLFESEKNRAENLMIVDLLRNDLGKISKYGSVKVKDLFKIEKYESLFQMISRIESTLKKGIKFSDVIKNIFPSGSITGAPKIRAMEIINELEAGKRGIYTGSIGIISKKKTAFNVAIRTLNIDKKTSIGELGIGSGIVWDSNSESEYDETLLKSRFITDPHPYFELLETMRMENSKILFIEEHIERLKSAADYFLFKFNEKKVRNYLRKIIASQRSRKPTRIRLTLSKWGELNHSLKQIDTRAADVKVMLAQVPVNSNSPFQYFKTTNRTLYDEQSKKFSALGFFDVIFLNENKQVTEGAISNIFVFKDGQWLTPPLNTGILNGIYRNYFLKMNPSVKEQLLSLNDLLTAEKILLTNSVRGETIVKRLYLNEYEYTEFDGQ